MTKAEYLSRLESLLSCLPEGQRAESLAFYEEMILDRMEEGLSEEEAVSTLDAPGVVAEAILDDLPAVPRVVAKTRRKSRVLLWVLVILGFPVWGALLAALAITVLSFLCDGVDLRRRGLGPCGLARAGVPALFAVRYLRFNRGKCALHTGGIRRCPGGAGARVAAGASCV